MTPQSLKEICEKIWEMESKYNLLNTQISKIFFWKLIRFPLFSEITKSILGFESDPSHTETNFLTKIPSLTKKVYNTYFYGASKRKAQRDILILGTDRKKYINGKYVDIYIEKLTKILDDMKANYEVIDSPNLGKHYSKPSKHLSYSEHYSIGYIIKKMFSNESFSESDKGFVEFLEQQIRVNFGLSINLSSKISEKIKVFKLLKYHYYSLLKKRNVKLAYIICSYGREAFISACKDAGVRCIELQHGVITKYHLGYSFPNNENVPYFPDELYLFGEFWKDSVPFPLKDDKLTVIGYPYMEKKLEKFRSRRKIKNQVIFISQWNIGSKLSKIAYDFAKKNSEYTVIYKLHPKEYYKWKERSPLLIEALNLNNFRLVDDATYDLYEYLANSEYLVGANSTAIYEGLVLKCKTILINLPGIEYMQYLIKHNYAKLAYNTKDIKKIIEEEDFKTINKEYFFKKFYPDKLKSKINL
jgi:hypothetical protein